MGTWPEEDAQDCLNRVRNTDGAEFFTFYDDVGECTAFAYCDTLDAHSCVGCYSGSADCPGLNKIHYFIFSAISKLKDSYRYAMLGTWNM